MTIETCYLRRISQSDLGTFGVFVGGPQLHPLAVSLELPWRDNLHGLSCIPAGTYRVTKHSGLRFADVWEVTNVPGRQDILIHWGNSIHDTEGCIIAAGAYGNPEGDLQVQASLPAIYKLRKLWVEDFDLIISNP